MSNSVLKLSRDFLKLTASLKYRFWMVTVSLNEWSNVALIASLNVTYWVYHMEWRLRSWDCGSIEVSKQQILFRLSGNSTPTHSLVAGMNKIYRRTIDVLNLISLPGFDTVSSIAEVIRDVEAQLGLRSCRWDLVTWNYCKLEQILCIL